MKILIVGSTGATGRLLVNQLLSKGHEVKAFARNNKNFTDETIRNKNLEIVCESCSNIADLNLYKNFIEKVKK